MFVLFIIATFLLIFAAAYGFLMGAGELLNSVNSSSPVANVLAGMVLFLVVVALWAMTASDIVTISR